MLSYKITKRNGELVDFDINKITQAISSAAKAVGQESSIDSNKLSLLVEENILLNFVSTGQALSAEDVQDLVEKTLMKAELHYIAKTYIIYRVEHEKKRQAEKNKVMEKIAKKSFKIINETGQEELFLEKSIKEQLSSLSNGLEYIEIDAIIFELEKNLFEGIKISELKRALLNAVVSLTERHYNYSFLASRLLWNELKNTVSAKSFKEYIQEGISYELLNPELADFDLDKISEAIDESRNNNFQYLGAQTVYDRYLLKTPNQPRKVFELPQWMWMRIAMGLALLEKDREDKAIEFYNVISQFLLIPSTPTLFNGGTTHSQLSSCYLNSIEDSLSGIFKGFSDTAMMSKWAGGVGTDWTKVRALGSKIKGTNGDSQGIIPFIKIYNDIAVAVNQGGKRRGALAAYLEVWHKDIEEFIELKKNTGDERRRAHDIHPAAWIPDLFMKRVIADENWTLFSPNEVPELHELYGLAFEEKYKEYEAKNIYGAKTIAAKDLWRKILTMLYETGHPWITFKDPCNLRSPQDHVGVVHNSNLCTEITLNNNKDEVAVCNLASLNLSKMVKDDDLDKELMEKTIRTGMRMLDNVIDVNFYSIPETKNANDKHRPVGLGLMGYHDTLYKLDIDFASDKNIEFADYSMELISYYAFSASSDLAKERGTYQSYKGSKWSRGILPIDTLDILEKERDVALDINKAKRLDWTSLKNKVLEQGMRNSNCLAIAPTATISNISGVVPCIEPIFKNIYSKENMSGSFLVINRHLIDDLITLNLWNKQTLDSIKYYNGSISSIVSIPKKLRDKYKETFEIAPEWIIKAAAHRAKWIDQSASTNIFVSTSSGKYLSELYINAWKTGLKTTYYLRTLAASQVSKTIKIEAPKACLIENPDCEACQ